MVDDLRRNLKKTNNEALRDEKGRLLPGTPSINPTGRPRRVVEAEALETLNLVWTAEKLKEVAQVLLSYALAGNITAALTILKYQAGSPPESHIIKTDAINDALLNLSDERIDKILADHRSLFALPSGDPSEPD